MYEGFRPCPLIPDQSGELKTAQRGRIRFSSPLKRPANTPLLMPATPTLCWAAPIRSAFCWDGSTERILYYSFHSTRRGSWAGEGRADRDAAPVWDHSEHPANVTPSSPGITCPDRPAAPAPADFNISIIPSARCRPP